MRVVRMSGFPIDIAPEGIMLVSPHTDKPGVIGQVGTILGNEKINIASMHLGRKTAGRNALMVLSVDSEVPAGVLEKITQLSGIDSVKQVRL
jgi:D-3-phosphoglycerate dehydrogenase